MQLRRKLKPTFVKNDLMFIPFHMHNQDRPSKGARCTQSAPGRSLVPFFQIRQITYMDLPYVKPDTYAAEQGFSEEQMQVMQAAWQRKYDALKAERQAAERVTAHGASSSRYVAAFFRACGSLPALFSIWLSTIRALLSSAFAWAALFVTPASTYHIKAAQLAK